MLLCIAITVGGWGMRVLRTPPRLSKSEGKGCAPKRGDKVSNANLAPAPFRRMFSGFQVEKNKKYHRSYGKCG